MRFKDIIGQEEIKNQLRKMADTGRLPHAQLYTGKAGVGKLPLALALAQYICCRERRDGEACGKCLSCRQISRLEHPDLHFVFPIYKSSSSKITTCDDAMDIFRNTMIANPYTTLDEWSATISEGKQCVIYASESDEIIRKLSYKPYEGTHKIMIIWGADKMNEVCSNKVLKILEEPPGDTIFILISERTEQLLTTITSRCQQLAIPPIRSEDLKAKLTELYEMTDEEMTFYSRNAMGSWSRLLQMINESEDIRINFELFKEMMRSSYTCNVKRLKAWAEDVAQLSRDRQILFLQNCQRLIRENFLNRLQQPELNYMSGEEKDFAEKFSPFIHERNIIDISEEISEAEAQISQNGNSKIVLFHLGIELYILLRRNRA